MGKVRTTGVMVGFLLENGKIITCMDTVFTPGQMDENMKRTTKMTKSTGLELTIGLMVVNTKVSGLLESSTVKESL